MGRPRYYDTVDDSRQISLSKLRKWGCLKGWYSGSITWTSSCNENSIGIEINLQYGYTYMRVHYTSTSNSTGEETPYDYRINLVKTPCHFGGNRWWFQCPECWRKVSTLMMNHGHTFACRTCLRLTYDSRQRAYHGRYAPLFRALELERKYKKLRETVKKMHYRGKATRKFRKVLKYKRYLDSVAPRLRAALDEM